MQTAAQLAVSRLNAAGYVAETFGPSLVKVQDPYCGYNSGKYAVDGYDTVTLRAEAIPVWKFIEGRK